VLPVVDIGFTVVLFRNIKETTQEDGPQALIEGPPSPTAAHVKV
jgi:hypothetical protein